MNGNAQIVRGKWLKGEWPFVAGLIITAVLALADFTILGNDFATDAWKSQYPWAELYPTSLVRTINYDTILEHLPWFEYAREEMLAGRMPLWNPYSFMGIPLYANHLCPVLYPPLTLCLFLFNGDDIIGWLAVLHLIIFGLSTYAFLRTIGIAPLPAFITACAGQFTGICFALWHPWAAFVAWAPAILALYEGFRHTRSWRYIAFAALIYGIVWLAAFPIIAIQFTYFLFIYIVIREISGPGRKPRLAIGTFLTIVILGLLISGVQNIPTLIYSSDTYRSAAYEHSMAFFDTPPPAEAMTHEKPDIPVIQRVILAKGRFVAPVAILRILDNRHFIGAPLLLFAVLGIFTLPPGRRHWLFLLLIFFALSFIDSLYLYAMKYIPLWNIRLYEPRELWHLCALVCAGYGLQSLFDGKAAAILTILKIPLAIFAALLVLFVGAVMAIEATTAAGFFPIDPSWLAGVCIFYFICVAAVAVIVCIGLFSRWSRSWYYAAILLTAIIAGGTPSRLLALPYTSDVPLFTPNHDQFIAEIEKAKGPEGRVARITDETFYLNFYRRAKAPFLANLTTSARLKDISGYDSLIPRRIVDYLNLTEDRSVKSLHAHISFNNPEIMTRDLFRAMGVGCIISDMPILPVGSQVAHIGGVYIHQLPHPFPRYYLAREVITLDSAGSVKPLLIHNGWLDKGIAYIDGSILSDREKDILNIAKPPDTFIGTAVKTDETPNRITFNVNSTGPGLLVLNDTYAPGWVTIVDGVKTRCLNANYLFRAAYIPRGEHTVEFIYRPIYMAWGWLATFVGLFIFLRMIVKPKHKLGK